MSTATRTASLSKPAVEALARLGARFPLVQAMTQYEIAAARVAELSDLALLGRMTDLEARSLVDAEDLMVDARATLALADRLDLIEVSR